MEIKNLLDGLNPYEQQKKIGESAKLKGAGRGSKAGSGDSGSDKISLSSEARLRGQALAEALSAPDSRAEKVERLKAQVQDGTYQPDSLKTARNLIRDDLELLLASED